MEGPRAACGASRFYPLLLYFIDGRFTEAASLALPLRVARLPLVGFREWHCRAVKLGTRSGDACMAWPRAPHRPLPALSTSSQRLTKLHALPGHGKSRFKARGVSLGILKAMGSRGLIVSFNVRHTRTLGMAAAASGGQLVPQVVEHDSRTTGSFTRIGLRPAEEPCCSSRHIHACSCQTNECYGPCSPGWQGRPAGCSSRRRQTN